MHPLTISAPEILGNDFQNMTAMVDWVFVVEGIDEEEDISDESTPPSPPPSGSGDGECGEDDLVDISDEVNLLTGDNHMILPAVFGVVLSADVIVARLIYKKKKRA